MTTYDIDPAVLAYADRHMAAVGADLAVLIQSYLTHRGNTDATVAFVVLLDNMRDALTFEQACDTLALAVHRLAENADAVAAERERIATAITDNVRNADFDKQDRGGFVGFTECMAYVAGHDKAAAIARTVHPVAASQDEE
jgi:hypothetical protein